MFPPSLFCLYKPALYYNTEWGMVLHCTSSADGKGHRCQRAVRSNPSLYLLAEMDPQEIDVTTFNIYSILIANWISCLFWGDLKHSSWCKLQAWLESCSSTWCGRQQLALWRDHICACKSGMLPRSGDSCPFPDMVLCVWSHAPALFLCTYVYKSN